MKLMNGLPGIFFIWIFVFFIMGCQEKNPLPQTMPLGKHGFFLLYLSEVSHLLQEQYEIQLYQKQQMSKDLKQQKNKGERKKIIAKWTEKRIKSEQQFLQKINTLKKHIGEHCPACHVYRSYLELVSDDQIVFLHHYQTEMKRITMFIGLLREPNKNSYLINFFQQLGTEVFRQE